MAVTAKSLADGQLSDTEADLYTAPSAVRISLIVLANSSASTAYTVYLKVKRSGMSDSRRLIGEATALPGGGSIETPSNGLAITLAAGDKIRGYADTADVVDYFICGAVG
jgi:hypothetical protein